MSEYTALVPAIAARWQDLLDVDAVWDTHVTACDACKDGYVVRPCDPVGKELKAQASTAANALDAAIVTHASTLDLTDKERTLYLAVWRGMDEPGCGWLHEVAPFKGKTLSALVGSLVTKGLLGSDLDPDPGPPCYWVWVLK